MHACMCACVRASTGEIIGLLHRFLKRAIHPGLLASIIADMLLVQTLPLDQAGLIDQLCV